MSEDGKQYRAAKILESQLDLAAEGEASTFLQVKEAVNLIAGSAVDAVTPGLAALRNEVGLLRAMMPTAAPIEPAPAMWEVRVKHYDRAGKPIGGDDAIGRYADEDRAREVAALLNDLTSSSARFYPKQV